MTDTPSAPSGPSASSPSALALPSLADELLEAAHAARSGRAVRALSGTPDRSEEESAEHGAARAHRGVLTQIILALTEGSRLSDHENPGEATLQVLRGAVRLSTAQQAFDLREGELLAIPQQRHDLRALTDAVVILTIARHVDGPEA